MILSTETMIWLHSKDQKAFLKAKIPGERMVRGILKQKFASPGFFTGPVKKAQEQDRH